jgi:hypothetical protein
MIAVDINGGIRGCKSLRKIPGHIEEFDRMIRQKSFKGCAVSFIRQNKKYTKEEALKKIEASIKALRYSKTHKLKPGVNIPGNKKYYALRKKLEKEIKKKSIEASKNRNITQGNSSINLN